MKKQFVKIVTAAVLTSSLLAGCGSPAAASAEGAVQDPVSVKLGVVGSIYDELWAPAKAKLEEEGIDLEIVQFSDYVTPNNALVNGEIDLNGFQHQIYLDSEIQQYGYEISNIGSTFIIPLNLYSRKVKTLDEIRDGDQIAIPNDRTNGGRALKVLEAAGLITLKEDAAFSPTKEDIADYRVRIEILELAANTIPSVLPDVTAAVINGNYALDFGLKTEEALFRDTSVEEPEYWNLVAARTEDLSDRSKAELYGKVMEAFRSQETEDVFNQQYGGFFIPAGWDRDLLSQYR